MPPSGDPIRDFIVALLEGAEPGEIWPRESTGLRDLLHIAPLPTAHRGASRLQDLNQLVADRVDRSVIAVHPTLAGMIAAAQTTLCPFDALRSARVVCRTRALKAHWELLIEEGRAKEFQDPTREMEPAVVLLEELGNQRFQEIFLALDFDPPTTPREELLRAAGAARVGLHLQRLPD